MALPSIVVPNIHASTVILEKTTPILSSVAQTALANGARVVAPHEFREAAACLAESFASDKIVRYCVDTPDRMHLSEEERFALHRASMEYVTYAHCLQGLVLTIGNFDCVALWLPPGKNIDDWWTMLRSGLWRLNYKLSKEGKIRFFEEFLPLLATTKLEVLGERDNSSWYLNYVGTKPAARGKGHARKLIDYVTNQVSLPCPTPPSWQERFADLA